MVKTGKRGDYNDEDITLPRIKRKHTDMAPDNEKGNQNDSVNDRLQVQSSTSKKQEIADPAKISLDKSTHNVEESQARMSNGHNMSSSKQNGKIHKRFDSEEPPAGDQLSHAGIKETASYAVISGEDAAGSENDSEDDEPDIVTASAGFTQVRNIVADAAKAAERQSQVTKEKRRRNDANLKQQAATAKRQQQTGKIKRNRSIPDLLPDEILGMEPMVRSTTPQLAVAGSRFKKLRVIDLDPKPPKDVTRSSVKIRVLEESRTALPPRGSKASRFLRESWLSGRRGRGDSALQRKKIGCGFLRK